MNTRITLPELVPLVAQATSTTERMSELFLREVFATIAEVLTAGENVTIKDLGTFKVQRPADGVGEAPTLLFVPAKKVAELLNQPFEAFVPIELDDDVTDEALDAVVADQLPVADDAADDAVVPPPFVPQPEAEVADEPAEAVHEEKPQPETVVAAEPTEAPATVPPPATLHALSERSEPTPSPRERSEQSESLNRELMERVRQESDRKSFWKGIAFGLVGGVLATIVMTYLLRPLAQTPSNAETQAVAQATDSTGVQTPPLPLVTDTISQTMFLTKMAVKHYGRYEFWVYIYEENKALIANPNDITPGTVMVIPPAEKYGIDANNPASVAKASQRSQELFSQFQ